MKFITTIILFLTLTCQVFSQQGVVNFGTPNQNTICSDGYIDDDGNSIVLMYNDASGFMIGSFDSYFNTNWITSFGVGSGTAGKLIKLSNGDFFGYILQDPNGRAHVFKFSQQGTIYWHHVLDNTSHISDCIELSNNNIAVIAKYQANPHFIVFNNNGVVQYSKTMSDGHYNQLFLDVINTNDGNNLLIGKCSDPSHEQRMVLAKVDENFNQIWTKSFECNGFVNDIRNSVQDATNNYYLVGASADTNNQLPNDFDLSILKFDSLGNYIQGKSFGSEFRDIATDIEAGNMTKNENGSITIIGNSKPVQVCGGNLLVLSMNSDLDTLFTKHYGNSAGTGTNYTELHSSNDSLYTFGSYTLWSNIGSSDGHLIKTDHSFNLDCEYYKSGLDHSSELQLTEINNPFTFSNTTLGLTTFQTTSTSTITVKDACSGETLGHSENERLELNLFPNPARNIIQISSGSKLSEVKIFDILGNEAFEIENVKMDHLKIDVSQLKRGCYIVQLTVNSEMIRKKLILE